MELQLAGSRYEQIMVLRLISHRFSKISNRTLTSRSSVMVCSRKSSRMSRAAPHLGKALFRETPRSPLLHLPQRRLVAVRLFEQASGVESSNPPYMPPAKLSGRFFHPPEDVFSPKETINAFLTCGLPRKTGSTMRSRLLCWCKNFFRGFFRRHLSFC